MVDNHKMMKKFHLITLLAFIFTIYFDWESWEVCYQSHFRAGRCGCRCGGKSYGYRDVIKRWYSDYTFVMWVRLYLKISKQKIFKHLHIY